MSPRRFYELSEETQRFLSDLREEDVELLHDGIDLLRSIRTVGKFVRWLLIGILGLVLGATAFWKAIQEMLAWKLGK